MHCKCNRTAGLMEKGLWSRSGFEEWQSDIASMANITRLVEDEDGQCSKYIHFPPSLSLTRSSPQTLVRYAGQRLVSSKPPPTRTIMKRTSRHFPTVACLGSNYKRNAMHCEELCTPNSSPSEHGIIINVIILTKHLSHASQIWTPVFHFPHLSLHVTDFVLFLHQTFRFLRIRSWQSTHFADADASEPLQ